MVSPSSWAKLAPVPPVAWAGSQPLVSSDLAIQDRTVWCEGTALELQENVSSPDGGRQVCRGKVAAAPCKNRVDERKLNGRGGTGQEA